MRSSEDVQPDNVLRIEIRPTASDPGTQPDHDAVSEDESHDSCREKLDNTHLVGEGEVRVEVNDEEESGKFAGGNLVIEGVEEGAGKGYDRKREEETESIYKKKKTMKYLCEGNLDAQDIQIMIKLLESSEEDFFDDEREWSDDDDPRGNIECRFYLSPGGCKHGDACRYSHSKEQSIEQTTQLNILGLPLRPSAKECKFYRRNGFCGFGANCHFDHPDYPAGDINEKRIGAVSYSVVLLLMRSAKAKAQSSGDGGVFDRTTSTSNNPKDRKRHFLYPFDTLTEQIRALELSNHEMVYLCKCALVDVESERFKSSFTGKFPELESRKTELDALSRRLRGIVRSTFSYPTYSKLYQVILNRTKDKMTKKSGRGQSSSGSQSVPQS